MPSVLSNLRTTPLGKDTYLDNGVHKRYNHTGDPDVVAIDVKIDIQYNPQIATVPWNYSLTFPAEMRTFFVETGVTRMAIEPFVGKSTGYATADAAKAAGDQEANTTVKRYFKYLKAKTQIGTHTITIVDEEQA